MGIAAPSAKERFAGRGMASPAARQAFSAYPPVSARPNTRSPFCTRVTPAPTASTSPHTSIPGMYGKVKGCRRPESLIRSAGLMPAARTRIWTCPACTWGSGASSSRNCSGPSNWCARIAFILVSSLSASSYTRVPPAGDHQQRPQGRRGRNRKPNSGANCNVGRLTHGTLW
jgi:hypothetical protein